MKSSNLRNSNLLRKHLLPVFKYLFSGNSYVCPIWIFIFDTNQAQAYSVHNTSLDLTGAGIFKQS